MKRVFVCTLLLMSSASFSFSEIDQDLQIEEHQFYDGVNIVPDQSELLDLSGIHKNFPENLRMRAFDPINRVEYEKVMLGPAKKAGRLHSYDYWRYVTVYNSKRYDERVSYLPYFFEDCHDKSSFMAQWNESRTIKMSIKSDIGFSELGLSASIGMSLEHGVTFSSSRRVAAEEGISANHYPHKLSDTFTGVTYILTYNESTRELGYIKPTRYQDWTNSYPYPFELDNQNIGFKVVREVIKTCEGYNPGSGSEESASDFMNMM